MATAVSRSGGTPPTGGPGKPFPPPPPLSHLGSLMRGVRSVDQVGVEERAAALGKRSIKKASKLAALDLVIRCMDLTTLEGADTPGKVAALCSKAVRPQPGDASVPSMAAVCVYPAMVPPAVAHVRGTGVKVASVATAFPSGQTFTSIKVAETREAVIAGADEIDMVIDRGAFLSGDYQKVYETLGPTWMTPDRFRIGASSLLNDVLMQIAKERDGVYQSGDYFTID